MNHSIFITRHGACIHNNKEFEHYWNLNNDDIMGLTPDGIEGTLKKAEYLSTVLDRTLPVLFVTSELVRSKQTASLLRTRLLTQYGFKKVDLSKRGVPLLNEFPSSSLEAPLPEDWYNTDFKTNPHHKFHESWGTFAEHAQSINKVVTSGVFANMMESVVVSTPSSLSVGDGNFFASTVPQKAQIVIVGHHYTLNALIGALYKNFCFDEQLESLDQYYLNKVLRFRIDHDQVLFMKQNNEDASDQYQEIWKSTHSLLKDQLGD